MDALTDEFASAISIHALRVEGDLSHSMFPITAETISIHALRVEGDKGLDTTVFVTSVFLSTPSGWRATPVFATALV